MSDTSKKREFLRRFSCCGFGCFFITFCLVSIPVGVYWFLKPIWQKLNVKPSIPKTQLFQEKDSHSVSEKFSLFKSPETPSTFPMGGINKAPHATQTELLLTQGELNALLSKFKPPPAMGLALDCFYLLLEEKKVILVCQGSGFGVREIFLIFDFSMAEDERSLGTGIAKMSRLKINGLEFNNDFELKIAASFCKQYLEKTTKLSWDSIHSAFQNVDIASKGVIIKGNISFLSEKVN